MLGTFYAGTWRRRREGPQEPALLHPGVLPKESTGELLQTIVLSGFGLCQNLLDVCMQARLAPIEPGRSLGQLGFVNAGGFEQRARGSTVESGIVRVWQVVIAAGHLAFRIISQECA